MAPIVAAFSGENQQSMYLGVWQFNARKPALLLGDGEKCASKVSKSGKGSWVNGTLLSNSVAVFVGKISYPLYLWHWPLLSFVRILVGETPSTMSRLLTVAASIALATLTYWLIERPVRYGTKRTMKTVVLLLLMATVGYIGYNSYERGGLSFRLKKLLISNGQLQFRQLPDSVSYMDNCIQRFPSFSGGCMLAKDKAPTVALLGDSHSLSLFYGLADITSSDSSINVLNLRRDSAVLLKGLGTFGRDTDKANQKELKDTATISSQAISIVAENPSIRTVILITRGPSYLSNKFLRVSGHPEITDNKEAWRIALQDTLSFMQENNRHVIVVIDWPDLDFEPRSCLNDQQLQIAETRRICGVPRRDFDAKMADYRSLVSSVTKAFRDVSVFDSSSYLCDEQWCWAMKDGHILYGDTNHLSLQGSRYIGNYLLPLLRQSLEHAK